MKTKKKVPSTKKLQDFKRNLELFLLMETLKKPGKENPFNTVYNRLKEMEII